MSDEPIRLVGCCVCGARWTELESDPMSGGCGCGSSAVNLERNVTGKAAKLLIEHGHRLGQGWDSKREPRHHY